jgi:hypothetical protein
MLLINMKLGVSRAEHFLEPSDHLLLLYKMSLFFKIIINYINADKYSHESIAELDSASFDFDSFDFAIFSSFFLGDKTITICRPSILGNCSTTA